MSVNSRLKATKIIGQRKAFYRQRIPEFSCARKETVDIDIFVTSRNGDRKIMQSIRISSRPPLRKRKWNQLSQFRWTSSKVILIEKTKAGYISAMSSIWRAASPSCLFLWLIQQFQVATRSFSPDMATIFHAWPYGRYKAITETS